MRERLLKAWAYSPSKKTYRGKSFRKVCLCKVNILGGVASGCVKAEGLSCNVVRLLSSLGQFQTYGMPCSLAADRIWGWRSRLQTAQPKAVEVRLEEMEMGVQLLAWGLCCNAYFSLAYLCQEKTLTGLAGM